MKKYYFEIHLTIRTDNIDKFVNDCRLIKVKPIIIDYYRLGEPIMRDLQISHTIYSTEDECYEILNELVFKFNLMKYSVMREKIEVDPSHPEIIINKSNQINNKYLEAHHLVSTPNCKLKYLVEVCSELNVHMSKNPFKIMDNDMQKIMITLRSNKSLKNFNIENDLLCQTLNLKGFIFEEGNIEYALYDNNITHDNEWIR